MMKTILTTLLFTTSVMIGTANAAAIQCDQVLVKWKVNDFVVNGQFTLNIGEKTISNSTSDSGIPMINGKLNKLTVDGDQISWTTRENHDLIATVNDKCEVVTLSGTGNHPAGGPYEILKDD